MAYTNPVVAAAKTIYAEAVLSELQKLTHPIAGFTTDLSDETAKPGSTIDADFAQASALQTSFPGYTSYTGGAASIKMDLDLDLSAGWTLDEAKLMSRGAAYVREQAQLNVSVVVQGLLAAISTEATSVRTTKVLTLAHGADFDLAALQATFVKLVSEGIAPAQSTLALSGVDYAKLCTVLPYNVVGDATGIVSGRIPGGMGIKDIVLCPELTTTDFVAARTGLVVAARAIPKTSEGGDVFQREYVKDPVTGLTLTLTQAFNVGTGATTFSVRCIAGVQVADPKAIVKIVRAAE